MASSHLSSTQENSAEILNSAWLFSAACRTEPQAPTAHSAHYCNPCWLFSLLHLIFLSLISFYFLRSPSQVNFLYSSLCVRLCFQGNPKRIPSLLITAPPVNGNAKFFQVSLPYSWCCSIDFFFIGTRSGQKSKIIITGPKSRCQQGHIPFIPCLL